MYYAILFEFALSVYIDDFLCWFIKCITKCSESLNIINFRCTFVLPDQFYAIYWFVINTKIITCTRIVTVMCGNFVNFGWDMLINHLWLCRIYYKNINFWLSSCYGSYWMGGHHWKHTFNLGQQLCIIYDNRFCKVSWKLSTLIIINFLITCRLWLSESYANTMTWSKDIQPFKFQAMPSAALSSMF